MKLSIIYLFVILNVTIINAFKILYLSPFSSKSHMNVFEPVILQLAKRNHHITVVSPYSVFQSQQNIREIVIGLADDLSWGKMSEDIVSGVGTHYLHVFRYLKYIIAPTCETYLKNTEVKELMRNGKQFDVVLVDSVFNDCALATAPILGKNVMLHVTTNLMPWLPAPVPFPLSYVPVNTIGLGSKMNFFQRMENTMTYIGLRLLYDYEYVPFIQAIIAKHVPGNPSIWDGLKSIDFTLSNADPIITSSRPLLPNIAYIGGMYCKKAKVLPKDLEDFIQGSGDNGFVLFSLGSIIKSESMSKDLIEGLLKAFASLKQRVIWKYEGQLENVPKNVKISKWLPQNDILGHPKIRLFITHGGLLSLHECIYHAVPIVAIPFFGEQPSNVAIVQEIEIGVKLDFHNITSESMSYAINEVIEHKSYAENMKRYSSIFHEFLESEKEKGVYWIEYVIRHNGARHFRTAGEELNFFQYMLLDIIGFLGGILLVVVMVVFNLGKFFVQKMCKCNKSALNSQKQKKL